jgi:hypothetical protein
MFRLFMAGPDHVPLALTEAFDGYVHFVIWL